VRESTQEACGNIGFSPSSGGASYPGLLLADVARTKAIQDAKGTDKALSLWKRKLADDIELNAPMQKNKKKTWKQQ
jgi:hypothetical protein